MVGEELCQVLLKDTPKDLTWLSEEGKRISGTDAETLMENVTWSDKIFIHCNVH